MKWLVLGLLACLARHGSGGAIKCLPSSTAPECAAEVKGLPVPKADIRQNIPQALVEITQDNSTMVTLPEVECLAGTEWESHCHSCQCSGFGIADCTRIKGCKEAQEANPIRCKPNTMFYRDCNTCICQESGLGLCTLMICAPVQPIQPVHDDCPPGTSWKIGCNTCTCVGDGRQLCTQMECTDKEGKPIPVRQGFDCAPETSWKVQCSSCTCSQDGHPLCSDLGCSNINAEPLWKCAPKSVWKNDCNECWCTETGQPICTRMACNSDFNSTNFFFDNKAQGKDEAQIEKESQEKSVATNKLGNEPDWVLSHNVVKRSQVCKPNQDFQSDCNTCKCASDGLSYRCTQNECMDKEEGVDKEVEVFMETEGVDHIERHSVCRARGVFYIGCNTCHCNYDGTDYTCTNKPCPLPDDVELFHELRAMTSAQNKTVVCVANRMFIKDCNTCWCNDDGTGFFCTRKVCVPELPEEGFDFDKPEALRVIQRTCRPDEVFEIDCNMCRCNPDGLSFSCTRRACLSEETVANEGVQFAKNASLLRKVRAVSQDTPRKTCQPSLEFRMDCNKCLCDPDGLSFSCTRIDCRAQDGGTRRRRDVAQQDSDSCTPGSVFERGCNVCRCNDDGKHATCTTKNCTKPSDEESHLPESDLSFRCYPGEQFKRSCNDCTCSADGKSVFCTLRICEKDASGNF